MINKKYSDFLPSLQGAEELMVQVDEVSKEMDVLKNYIENEVCVKMFKYSAFKERTEQTGSFTALSVCNWCFCMWTQVQQNINVAVTEYAKLKQQLEKNNVIIKMLGYLKEVQHMLQFIIKIFFST